MSKLVKILLIVAIALSVVGGATFTIAMATNGWDFEELSNTNYENITYDLSDDATDTINIDFDVADIEVEVDASLVRPSVTYPVKKSNKGELLADVSVSESNGRLTVSERRIDKFMSFDFNSPKVTIRLPENQKYTLNLETDVGDVTVNAGGSVKNLNVSTDTGDAKINGVLNADVVDVETDTGEIKINGDITALRVELDSDTGDISCAKNTKLTADKIHASTDTGDIQLSVSGARADYKIIVEKELGKSNVTSQSGGTKVLDLSVDIGDIEINFLG